MLSRFALSGGRGAEEETAKVWSLLPSTTNHTGSLPFADAGFERASRLAEQAVSLGTNDFWHPRYQLAKVLTEYHQAHFGEAVEWMQRVLTKAGKDSSPRDATA
jgi:hypothetical protein